MEETVEDVQNADAAVQETEETLDSVARKYNCDPIVAEHLLSLDENNREALRTYYNGDFSDLGNT